MFDTRLDFPARRPYYLGVNLVYNHFDFFKSQIHFFEDLTPSYLIQDDNYLRFYGGIPFKGKGKVEASIASGMLQNDYYQTNNFTREDTADRTRFYFNTGQAAWEINSLNRKQYASAGARFRLSLSYVNGTEKFENGSLSKDEAPDFVTNHDWLRLKLLWDNYFEKIGPLKLGFYGEVNISNQSLFNNYTSSLLAAPAFDPIPEAKTIFLPYFRAYNYGAAGIKAVWALSKNIELRTDAYLYQPYQEIIKNPDNTASLGPTLSNRHWMASGAIVYHTFLMPISLSVNYFDDPDEQFFVALNIGYILFNKRAFE
jgi:NTE family protein